MSMPQGRVEHEGPLALVAQAQCRSCQAASGISRTKSILLSLIITCKASIVEGCLPMQVYLELLEVD